MGSSRHLRWDEMDKNHTPLEKLIRHFEVHNRTEGKFTRTVEWYKEGWSSSCAGLISGPPNEPGQYGPEQSPGVYSPPPGKAIP